jgi:hypothetical protein
VFLKAQTVWLFKNRSNSERPESGCVHCWLFMAGLSVHGQHVTQKWQSMQTSICTTVGRYSPTVVQRRCVLP